MSAAQNLDIDIDHLREWIGRTDVVEDEVQPSAIGRWHATLDEKDGPEAFAVVPRLAHWMFFAPHTRQSELGLDGHPTLGGFLPPMPLPRRMWAGGELVFRREIAGRGTIRRSTRIEDISLKEGRQGQLLFLTLSHRISHLEQIAIEERQTIVYRAPAADPHQGQGGGPVYQGPAFDWEDEIIPDETMLFRYSALTFNAHRIHYDRTYALGEEDYPDLVVQGPLTASLLIVRAARWLQQPPMRFAFRGVSPLFVNQPIRLCGRRENDGLALWALGRNGRIGMTATAQVGS